MPRRSNRRRRPAHRFDANDVEEALTARHRNARQRASLCKHNKRRTFVSLWAYLQKHQHLANGGTCYNKVVYWHRAMPHGIGESAMRKALSECGFDNPSKVSILAIGKSRAQQIDGVLSRFQGHPHHKA